jgi:hypothetical protein
MKNLLAILILWLNCNPSGLGQNFERPINIPEKGYTAEMCFETATLKDLDAIKNFIISKNDFLENPAHKIILTDTKVSPIGKHYIFNHFVNGIPVNNSSVRICVGPQNNLVAASFNLIPVDANKYLTAPQGNVIFYHHGITALAHRREFRRGLGHYESFISLEGDTLLMQDRKLHLYNKDTIAKAKVFLPNPLQSAKLSYGIPYVDSGDIDVQVLREELKEVMIPARFQNDTFFLGTSLYSNGEVYNPKTIPAFSLNDTFYFNRSQNMFEDVNAFYHVYSMSEYIRTLGFSDLLDTLVIDAHAGETDNSAFDPFATPRTLEFGLGCVDDAEDGQVVVHEFAHSFSNAASEKTVEGSQRESMEEGTADYFSVSYSRQFTDFNWDRIFSWDGHNECWEGFSAKSKKRYPENIKNIPNNDREIWSTALMCIYEQLGKAVTDSLVLINLYLQAPNTTMPQMALVMLKVDTVMWNADHAGLIYNCFVERGILAFGNSVDNKIKEELFSILNSGAFASGTDAMQIKTNSENVFSTAVYSVSGQLIQRFDNIKNTISISPEYFSSGVYILELRQNGKNYHYKFSKW